MEGVEQLLPILANPLAIVATMLLCLSRIAKWVGPMIEKLVARHVQFMECIERSQEKIQESINANTLATNEMRLEIRELRRRIDPTASSARPAI